MQSKKSCDMNIFANIFRALKYIMGSVIRNVFATGDFVFAKMKFFPPWPARVEQTKANYARVRFLGDNDQW